MHRYTIAACVLAATLSAPAPDAPHAQTPTRRERMSPAPDPAALRREIEALNAAMVAAFKRNPASVAAFYTDDARLVGLGTRIQGRQAIDAYWAPLTGFTDWSLEVLDAGGNADSPWLLGRSTLVGQGGRTMITEFLGVLRRMPDGTLKYAVDFYTSAPRPQTRQPQQPATVAPTPASAPSTPRSPFAGPGRTTLAAPSVTIPLSKVGQYYFADVTLNGRPFRFTIETGAGFFGISRRAATALGLRVDTIEVSPGYRAPVALVDSLTMGSAKFERLSARVVDSFDDQGFDGIISIPVLRDVLATFDLSGSRLVLERGALAASNGRNVFPIAGKDRGGRVDFEMTLGNVTVPAVLDTRSYIPFVLPDSLESSLRFSDALRSAGMAAGPSMGTFNLRGAHLASDIRIGMFGVRRPGILLRNRPGAVVGVPFMEQFVITIDQQNQRIRFARPGSDPVAVIPAQSWETGTTPSEARGGQRPAGAAPAGRPMGFNIASRGGTDLVVVNLLPGSYADRAGVRNDDRIVEFDGTAAAEMNPAVFRAAVAKTVPVKVVVLRGGQRMEFMILPLTGQ